MARGFGISNTAAAIAASRAGVHALEISITRSSSNGTQKNS
jgi:hypothetical protein